MLQQRPALELAKRTIYARVAKSLVAIIALKIGETLVLLETRRFAVLGCFVGLGLVPARAGTFTTLYSFTAGNDGAEPVGGVIYRNGALYGTATQGGAYGAGTVFEIDASTGSETTLHTFPGALPDGDDPSTGLLYLGGYLYGSTITGGVGDGDLFKLNARSGAERIIYSFQSGPYEVFPTNVVYANGALYGATFYTTDGQYGSVFKFDLKTGQETTLYAFAGGTDGGNPAQVIYDRGILYGVTLSKGASGAGTLFSIDPSTGAETTLHAFGSGRDGQIPEGLVEDHGVLYGTSRAGGNANFGAVFKYVPTSGDESTLYSFAGGNDGCNPFTGPVIYKDHLYGSTEACGGNQNGGTLFSVGLASGKETTLYRFPAGVSQGGAGALAVISGTLYGTTESGGSSYVGSVFKYVQ